MVSLIGNLSAEFLVGLIISTGGALIGCVIWFVRLEGKVYYLEKDQEKTELLHKELKELNHLLVDMKVAIGTIKGRLGISDQNA
jgi:hypothetical protein